MITPDMVSGIGRKRARTGHHGGLAARCRHVLAPTRSAAQLLHVPTYWRSTSVVGECPLHTEMGRLYQLVRCCHVGDRFVAQFKSTRSGFIAIDYVQGRRSDGRACYREEIHDWHDPDPAVVEAWWAQMVSRLHAGILPEPARTFRNS